MKTTAKWQSAVLDRPHSGSYKTLLDGEWKLQVAERPRKMWPFDLKADPFEHLLSFPQHPDDQYAHWSN